ncbi:isochorismatase family protein [Kribbella qitaiheensis]|uniref:Isochorismatase family protein n=1 Tax=Kribbella qitaiheensis TaxID=1544730 RepID=A0A7G6WVJ3_9ACTN|nr:isochorismatase family protein [Kribbella qitaiheensis]QNE18008.1 isochorismatase family protein [Kribbella qitaiheensis]
MTLPVDALIVVDVQLAGVTGARAVPAAAQLIDRTTDLIARARKTGALVVHLQNDGAPGTDDAPHTPGWPLHHTPEPGPTEHTIRKPHDDGFANTSLGTLLEDLGIKSIALCGLMSEMCVQATARTALARGYRVVLPHDAHATHNLPATPDLNDEIPAATVSRVAEWALGNELEIPLHAAEVTFTPAATQHP